MALDKTTIIQNAQKYAAKGQSDKAIEEWQKLVKENPNDGNVFNSIGDLYLKKNKNSEAVSAFTKAGIAFEKAGFALKTIAVYKKIIKLEPDNQDIHIKLADLDAERGLVGNAIEEYLKVIRQYSQKGFVKEVISVYKKIVVLDPNNVMVRNKLIDLLGKEGDKKGAAEQYVQLGLALKNQNKILEGEEALRRAISLDPNQAQAQALLKDFRSAPAAAPVQAPAAPSAPSQNDFSGPVEFSLDDTPSVSSAPVTPDLSPAAPAPAPAEPQPEMQILRNSDSAGVAPVTPPVQPEQPANIGLEDFSIQGASLLDALSKEETPSIPEAEFQPGPTGTGEHLTEQQIKEKLAEGEFYSQQGLLGESRIIYETVLKFHPEHPLAKAKLQRILGEMGESAESVAPSPDIDLGSYLPSDPGFPSAELGLSDELSSAANSVEPGKVRLKTTILDKTEGSDFVNLAGELEEQFKDDAAVASEGDVQEEDFGRIIKEFQKGIQNSISEKDYETHFDLGIAYKEMGLRTEAIGEFQFSIKGGGRVVDSAIMLSQCYLEAGLPKIAIEQIQKIVQSPKLTKDQVHSLKYELGSLFEKEGRQDEAIEIFGDILKENAAYRDVSKKIAKLRDAPARKS